MTSANQFKIRYLAFAAAVLLTSATAKGQIGPDTAGSTAKINTATPPGKSVTAKDKFGKAGDGPSMPMSKLMSAGMIESQAGGTKFPDGTANRPGMQDPALTAFQKELDIHFPAGEGGGSVSFSVPVGKRLVIETLTLRATTGNGGHFGICELVTYVNGIAAGHQLIPTFMASGSGADLFAFQKEVRIYADSPDYVLLQASRSGTGIIGAIKLTISGYLLDRA